MNATPTLAVVRSEARLFGRELGAVFWIVGFPVILLCVLGAIPSFRVHDRALGGQSVIDLYVPVAVLLAVLMASVQAMPAVVTGYRERGILRRFRATPVSPGSLLAAQAQLHGLATVLSAALVLAVGRVVLGVSLPGSVLGWLFAFALAVTSCLSLGAVVTAVSPSSKVAGAVASVVFFPMMFTAGVWVPVQAMPDVLRSIVLWTPLGAGAEALNDATLGRFPPVLDLLVMAGWSVVLGCVAIRSFRWE